jgi:hypothetical protein
MRYIELAADVSRRNWANAQSWFGRAMPGIGLTDSSRGHQGHQEASRQADLPQRIQRKPIDPQHCPDSALAELPVHPNPEPGQVAPGLTKAADPQKRSPLAKQAHP